MFTKRNTSRFIAIIMVVVLVSLNITNVNASNHSFSARQYQGSCANPLDPNFISTAAAAAVAGNRSTGVPISVTIAQAILESSWGQKHIGDAYNYFGIKATRQADGSVYYGKIAIGYVEVDTNEVSNGKTITVKAYFRKYSTMDDSFTDHANFFVENQRYSEAMQHVNDPDEFARLIHKAGYATDPDYSSKLINIMQCYDLYQYDQAGGVPAKSFTTVLVFDTSGSMAETDSTGVAKIQAAQKAGGNILDVISTENRAAVQNEQSQVGAVGYSTTAYVVSNLSTDINAVKNSLQNLTPTDSTGMAAGLSTGVGLFGTSTNNKGSILILLSDGLPNVPLNSSGLSEDEIKQEVIGISSKAGSSGICVYTVGFGDPNLGINSIDEDFLRRVADASGCGKYYNARDAIELANIYVELRHTSTGNVLLNKSGQINQDQEVDLGSVPVAQYQSKMLFTLNWPGSKLEPKLLDPTGNPIDQNYPGATISTTSSMVSIIVNNPKAGDWRVRIVGVDVPEGQTYYKALLSTRLGQVVLPTPTPLPAPTFVPVPPKPSPSGFPLALITVIIAGGLVGVYAYSRSLRFSNRFGGAKTSISACFRGISGEYSGRTIRIKDGEMFGRGSVCAVRLSDPSVSRTHALIRFGEGAWFIQDSGSSGGIFVNGQRVRAKRLNPGDQIRLGQQVFIFEN